MSTIGDALLEANDPPIRALFVYNSNPVAVAPDSTKVVAGFSREDLFCVVHDVFQTDTADYADIVLPATTQLEHVDVHSSYGHLYALANNRGDRRRSAKPSPIPKCSGSSPRAWASTSHASPNRDDDMARNAFVASPIRAWRASTGTRCKRKAGSG